MAYLMLNEITKGKNPEDLIANLPGTWGGQKKKGVISIELVSWRPFGKLSSFRGEMDKLWNRFFREIPFAT